MSKNAARDRIGAMNDILFSVYTIAPGSCLQIFLTWMTVAVSLALALFFGLKGFDKRKVLFVTGIILAVSEIIKAPYLYFLYGSYPWSDFPFQLCSIPMYLCIINYFLPRLFLEHFTMVYSIIGAVASFLVPAAVFSPYLMLTVHSLFWHGGLFFLGVFLIIRQKSEDLRIKNFIPVGLLYIGLSAAAVIMNAALFETSGGRANMFFLGPGFPDMFILNDIYYNSGWIPATLGMMGVTLASGLAVYLLIILLKKKLFPKIKEGFHEKH